MLRHRGGGGGSQSRLACRPLPVAPLIPRVDRVLLISSPPAQLLARACCCANLADFLEASAAAGAIRQAAASPSRAGDFIRNPPATSRRRLPPAAVARTSPLNSLRWQGRACSSMAAMEQVKGQLTLFDLKKVVSSKQT